MISQAYTQSCEQIDSLNTLTRKRSKVTYRIIVIIWIKELACKFTIHYGGKLTI